MAKKETTIDDLAGMVQRGFLEVVGKMGKLDEKLNGRMDKLGARMVSVEYNQYEMNKKLDGLAYRFEV